MMKCDGSFAEVNDATIVSEITTVVVSQLITLTLTLTLTLTTNPNRQL